MKKEETVPERKCNRDFLSNCHNNNGIRLRFLLDRDMYFLLKYFGFL